MTEDITHARLEARRTFMILFNNLIFLTEDLTDLLKESLLRDRKLARRARPLGALGICLIANTLYSAQRQIHPPKNQSSNFTQFSSSHSSSSSLDNGVLDLDELAPCIDRIRPFIGPSFENRIRSMLEEFVCKQNSRYAKRFPRLKRFLGVVAAWADSLDATAKGRDVRQEIIKYAIEHLAKNGPVTQFRGSFVPNRGDDRVDPGSLADEQDTLKDMNVRRFINEKDFWLCQDCVTSTRVESRTNPRVPQRWMETSNSDLDVEIGSVSQEPSTLYCTCRTSSFCDLSTRNIENAISSRTEMNYQRVQLNSNTNSLSPVKKTIDVSMNINCFPHQENSEMFDKYETNCKCNNTEIVMTAEKFAETQTSCQDVTFVFNSDQSPLNHPSKTVTNNPKPFPRKVNFKSSTETIKYNNCNRFAKSCKLKIYVHKTTSTDNGSVRTSPKVSNLSLPCKSSQLIVRIFEADPSLSDSCLILMRKKFEKDIDNACSCVNDILKRLDDSEIKQSRLNCEIRPGRVDLNLVCKGVGISKSRWFLARVPTCSNVRKRDSCCDSRGSCEIPCTKDADAPRSTDLPVDPPQRWDAPRGGQEIEERRVAFYSICSDHRLSDETRASTSRREIGRHDGEKGVNFIWSKGEKERQLDFVVSSQLTSSRKSGDFVKRAGNDEVARNEACSRIGDEICDKRQAFLMKNEGEDEGTVDVSREIEEIVDVDDNRVTVEDSGNRIAESCNCKCVCSSNGSKEDVYEGSNSISGGCNPGQCFCHVLLADSRSENVCIDPPVECSEMENRIHCHCSSKENTTIVEGHILQTEENALEAKNELFETKNSVFEVKKEALREEENTFELKDNISPVENDLKLGTGACCPNERRKVSDSDVKEVYSVDSIDTSCGSKCSCCGEELTNRSLTEETNNIEDKNSVQLIESNKIRKSNAITTENVTVSEDVKDSTIVQSSRFKTISNISEESKVASSRGDQCSKKIDSNFSWKPSEHPKQSSAKHNSNRESAFILHPADSKRSNEKDPSITESLFVFCRRSNVEQSSSTLSSSTDEEISATNNVRTKIQETPRKYNPPFKRATLSSCHHKSIYSTVCAPSFRTKNRDNSTRRDTKCDPKEEAADSRAVPRHENRSWRKSMATSGLCNSFPAIDRIKYLIRRKLRKLLLEERDKGTSTSKTFLRNDRYLISISSEKLHGDRTYRESCSAGSSIRSPFTTRNRYKDGGASERTFAEGILLGKDRNAFGDILRARCQRLIQGNRDIFEKIRTGEGSRSLSRKYSSKSTDTRDLIGYKGGSFRKRKSKIKGKEELFINERNRGGNRSNVAFSNSGRITFLNDHGDHHQKPCHVKDRRLMEDSDGNRRNHPVDLRSRKNCSKKDCLNRGDSGSSLDSEENRRRRDAEGRVRSDKLRSFEKRLFKLERKREGDDELASFLDDYERRIDDLDADFRLKLLQYVMLCRSVKNSLMKRLQLNDVYEVSSSSV
ncbi:uncharacterized protein LOC143422354 [Xylocopa sonorina]|uniref:uncharacterized protein LOC143422354 n=1 Tax=Xylocopa sonorina TaxID=1818115 RepID=UPI00403AC1C7